MTIGKPAFCFHFRGELQHSGDVTQQKLKCRPIRTREIAGVSLSGVLYVTSRFLTLCSKCNSNIFYSSSFAKAAKIQINLKNVSTAEEAMGKNSRCRYSTE